MIFAPRICPVCIIFAESNDTCERSGIANDAKPLTLPPVPPLPPREFRGWLVVDMVVVVVMLVTPVLLNETDELVLVGWRCAAAAAAVDEDADDDTDDEADNEEVEEGVLVVAGGVNCSRPTGCLLPFSPNAAAVAVVVDDEILVIELVAEVELTDKASSFVPTNTTADVIVVFTAPVVPPLIMGPGSAVVEAEAEEDEVPLKLCCC